MKETLLELLKNARISKKLTQRDVAVSLGVKDNTISNWEKGRSEPDIDTFIKLCDIYEVNFTDLLEQAYRPNSYKNIFTFPEQELIKKYRSLSSTGKATVDAVIDVQYEANRPKIEDTAM